MTRFKKQSILFLLGLLTSLTIAQAGPVEFYFQHYLENKTSLIPIKSIYQANFNQLIDHNNPSLGQFSQRYYIDESYGPDNDAPVFFYICGESTCTERALNGAIRTYAQKHHAKLVALEHRYYGQSLPFNSFSAKALRYLSTEAALDDLAYFQRKISSTNNWDGKWVAFGGSYPGSLSAYYRLKYPYLVVGSLASSAPVLAKEDFIEYDAHVTKVAGPQCANQIRQTVSEIEASLNNPNEFQRIKALFQATEVKDSVDFLYLIADIGASAVQYGMRDDFCNSLNSTESPLEGYANFAKRLYDLFGVSAVEMTVQSALSEDPDDYPNRVGMRQWYYQSCKEYGYWQNAHPDPEKTTRSSLINLDYHQRVCQRLFGINEPAKTAELNNTFYFPLMSDLVSRIYFTNGENDPWSTLSLTVNNGNAGNTNLSYYLIKGAAHCDDLRTPSTKDSNALKNARKTMESLLEEWLK